MNASIAGHQEKLKKIKQLEDCDGWRDLILPELIRLKTFHSNACRDRKLTPEKRAEHIEASFMAETLLDYLPSLRKSHEASIAQLEKGNR